MTRSVRVVLAAVVLLALAGCTSHEGGRSGEPRASGELAAASAQASPSPTGEPQTYDAAKAVVDQIVKLSAIPDGGALWDLLTSSGKAVVTRGDYATIVKSCPKLLQDGTVTSIALNNAATVATVNMTSTGGDYSWSMIYEAGHWLHQPSSGAIEWMSLKPDAAKKLLHNYGMC